MPRTAMILVHAATNPKLFNKPVAATYSAVLLYCYCYCYCCITGSVNRDVKRQMSNHLKTKLHIHIYFHCNRFVGKLWVGLPHVPVSRFMANL